MLRYEWKARLVIGLFCLLIGMTFGWLSGGAGVSKWWIYGIDLLFLVAVVRFIMVTYFKTSDTKQTKNGEQ